MTFLIVVQYFLMLILSAFTMVGWWDSYIIFISLWLWHISVFDIKQVIQA